MHTPIPVRGGVGGGATTMKLYVIAGLTRNRLTANIFQSIPAFAGMTAFFGVGGA